MNKQNLFFVATLLILVYVISACATAAQGTEVTQTPQSSQTPLTTPIPTFGLSSLPTVDLSSLPTLDPSTPLPTTTSLAIQTPYFGSPEPDADCFATASIEDIRLNPGPFISAYQLLPTMEPSVRYQVIDRYQTFIQFARDGVPVGWVEFPIYTPGYSTEGAGCVGFFNRPTDARALTDIPGLCFFKVHTPSETFQDSALTEPHFIHLSPSSDPFVVLWKSRKSIFTSLSHAGPSFHVPTDNVSIFGDCEGIPTSATVTTAGWLWSKPDERQGKELLRLTVGMHLHIEGKRPPDSSAEGAWVQAVADIEGKTVSGWVWSALLTYD